MKNDLHSQNTNSFPRIIVLIFLILLVLVLIIVLRGKSWAEGIDSELEKEMASIREIYKQEKYLESIRLCNKVIAKYGDGTIEAGAVLNLSIRRVIKNGLKKAEKYYAKGDYLKSITTTYATMFFAASNNHPPSDESYDLLDKALEAYLKTLPESI